MQRDQESGGDNSIDNIHEKPRYHIQHAGNVDCHIWCFLLLKGKLLLVAIYLYVRAVLY